MLPPTTTTLVLLFLVSFVQCQQNQPFRVIREWKYINFTFANEDQFNGYVAKGLYVPDNNAIAGIGYFEGFYYLTLPRMYDGVPATLTRIPEGVADGGDTAPLLSPYPSWEMNSVGNCDAIQNAQNIEIDAIGRMWIIDGGKTSTMARFPVVNCVPKIVIYDIKSNRTVLSYQFPEEVANPATSFLYDLVVDDTNGGYAYITDNSKSDPGIIVFEMRSLSSWKIRDERSMRADLTAIRFQIDGEEINTPINVAGIALGPKNARNDRQVYYSPISSFHLFSTNSTYLRNNTQELIVKDLGEKPTQSDGMIMDDKGVLYYGLLGSSSLAKWNSSEDFAMNQKYISKDPNYIQWPNSFAFDNKGAIVVLTNRLHKFIRKRMNLNEPNFRLLSSNVSSNSYINNKNIYEIITEATTLQQTTTTTTTTDASNHIHFQKVTSTSTPYINEEETSCASILNRSVLLLVASLYLFLLS